MIDILRELKRPFHRNSIHWRVGATTADKTKGMALAYIDARDVQDRLDDVCGVNWSAEYPFEGCCRIGIMFDGNWHYRSNGAGETSYEGEKGKYSDSFKRAAVLWGVGRYLYGIDNSWYKIDPQKKVFTEKPVLPMWAQPECYDALCNMIEAYNTEDYQTMADNWQSFDEKTKTALWVAPKYGGCLTTAMRTYMQTPEFREMGNGKRQ